MIMAPAGNKFPSIIILFLCSMLHVAVLEEYHLNLEGISAKQTVCSESKVLGDRSVKIVHAYGPCSPTHRQSPTIAEMLARDLLRQAHLHEQVQPQAACAANHSVGAARLGQSASTATVPVADVKLLGGMGYMFPIFVGTPARKFYVTLDTGSNLCWIQCEPCIHCYAQEQPIFNPATSSSLSYVRCNDPACNHRPGAGSCNRGRCTYHLPYADGSRSSGFIVRERVALVGAARRGNFKLGCGNNNTGPFSRTAGLFGLGRTDVSLNKQMSHMGTNIFSYCLPPTYRDSGHLTLGDGPYPPALYTPIVAEPAHPDRFYVGLSEMRVNNRLLRVPEGLFVGAKTFIDVGSLISYIPEQAYTALRMAIRNSMTHYRLVPSVYDNLDTCYNLGNATVVDSPTITLHFTGATLRLEFAQTFLNEPEQHIYCLAFATQNFPRAPSVIGAIQMRGLEVIYDLDENKIGFSTIITNCR